MLSALFAIVRSHDGVSSAHIHNVGSVGVHMPILNHSSLDNHVELFVDKQQLLSLCDGLIIPHICFFVKKNIDIIPSLGEVR